MPLLSVLKSQASSLKPLLLLVALLVAPPQVLARPLALEAPPVDPLEEPLAPFAPLKARTGAEEDRLHAAALFAAGRMAEQKQDYAHALPFYERALRYDPSGVAILEEIVPLAFNLGRSAEAVRYALLAAEADTSDPTLLRRLALYLSQSGDFRRAIKLYEKALAAPEKKPSPTTVLLSMELGRLYFLTRQHAKAAERFTLVAKAMEDPKAFGLDDTLKKAILDESHTTYQLFGETFLDAGMLNEALRAFEKSNSAKPNAARRAFALARVAARQKNAAEALSQLSTYFATHSADEGTAACELMADLLDKAGRSAEVAPRLAELAAADPENIPIAYSLAKRYAHDKRTAKAIAAYKSLIDKSPAKAPIEAYSDLAALYFEQHEAGPLLEVLGKLAATHGSLVALEEQAGKFAADKSVGEALTAAARAPAPTGKGSYGSAAAMAHLAMLRKDPALARTFVDRAAAADAKQAPGLALALSLEALLGTRFAEGIALLERGLALAQTNDQKAGFHFYLAGALEMDGHTDRALEHARAAAEADPKSVRFESRKAWILYHAKRYGDARLAYQQFLEKHSANYESTDVRELLRDARLVLSNIEVAQGHLPQAEEWLEQVLDEFPEDVGASNDLGYLWADRGKRLEAAHRLIQHAVAAEPDNVAYRDSLGWVLFRLGRYAEAVEHLKKATAGPSPDAVVLDHLGEAATKQGDRRLAAEAWTKAEEAFKKEHDAAKAAAVAKKRAALGAP